MKWIDGRGPERPNRYQDWAVQTGIFAPRDPAKITQDPWVKVQAEVLDANSATSQNALGENLIWLFDLVTEDQAFEGFSPRMAPHEFERLSLIVSQIKGNGGTSLADLDTDPAHYFLYLPERQVFDTGEFRSLPFLRFLDATPPFEAALPGTASAITPSPSAFSHVQTESASAVKAAFPEGSDDGPAVAIGIIDDGIAFAHEAFGDRVEHIWLQERENPAASTDGLVAFGRMLDKAQIAAIRARLPDTAHDADIYRQPEIAQIDFSQTKRPALSYRTAHGTHVLDLAAGTQSDAPDFQPPILAVQLPQTVTADTSGTWLTSYVLEGIQQIMRWADALKPNMPLVINFSYGFAAGPKDGSLHLEQEIDRLVNARLFRGGPTTVVLPAGNSREDSLVAKFWFDSSDQKGLNWVIPPDDETDNFLEIWVDDLSGNPDEATQTPPLDLQLTPPNGEVLTPPQLTFGQLSLLTHEGQPVAGVYCDQIPSGAGEAPRYRYFLAINRSKDLDERVEPAPFGPWTVTLQRRDGMQAALSARLYIQRDDTPSGFRRRGRQSYFDHMAAYTKNPQTGAFTALGIGPISAEDTLNAIATGVHTVVVGGTYRDQPLRSVPYSASGPARTKTGPDLSAVSDESIVMPGVLAAGSNSGAPVAMRGTSVAAPQIARWVAQKMAAGVWKTQAPALQIAGLLATDVAANPDDPDGPVQLRKSSRRLGVGRPKPPRPKRRKG